MFCFGHLPLFRLYHARRQLWGSPRPRHKQPNGKCTFPRAGHGAAVGPTMADGDQWWPSSDLILYIIIRTSIRLNCNAKPNDQYTSLIGYFASCLREANRARRHLAAICYQGFQFDSFPLNSDQFSSRTFMLCHQQKCYEHIFEQRYDRG